MCSVWFYSSELNDNIGKQLCEGVSHVSGVVRLFCEGVSHVFSVVLLRFELHDIKQTVV